MASQPGETQVQLGRDDMRRFLTGLIGSGILASRSPWMHEQEGDAQGVRLVYSLFDFADRGWDAERLPGLLAALQDVGFAGVNVTYPFKQAIIPLLDELSPEAEAICAVNTVAFRDGRSIGHNTDMLGFAEGMARGLPGVRLDRVLQLGCGGAGAAVAHALLARSGVDQVVLHDVEFDRAERLAAQLAARYGAGRVHLGHDPVAAAAECAGIVNATPVGMAKFPGLPLATEAIHNRHWVADIVYFPLETEFLREARRKGCATLDGSRMAVHQAAEAFTNMTGLPADAERMMRSFAAFTGPSPRAAA